MYKQCYTCGSSDIDVDSYDERIATLQSRITELEEALAREKELHTLDIDLLARINAERHDLIEAGQAVVSGSHRDGSGFWCSDYRILDTLAALLPPTKENEDG